jgi:4-diphosphocytidyl-2-C-methyl-D-erythritol kinase
LTADEERPPRSVKALCNAKVNLYLKVKARLSDGFHEIETIYHSISLADTVTVAPRSEGLSVSSNSETLPRDSSNLAVRAAAQILGETPSRATLSEARSCRARAAGDSPAAPGATPCRGAHMDIQKQIPIGSGLGGGSADAAGTLVCVNRLYGLGHQMAALERMAEAIGADTKFMLRGGCAVGTGRGDRLEFISPLPPLPVLVVVPNITISTAWAYDSLKMGLTTRNSKLTMIASALEKGDVASLCDLLENDFERLIFERFPIVKRIKDELAGSGARAALMSGSGSSVFGIFSKVGDAEASAETLSRQGLKVFATSFAVRGVTTPE